MIYPNNFETKVGFDKIKEILKKNCLSELGRNEVDNISFSIDSEKITVQLKQIEEFKNIIMFSDNFPVSYYIDTRSYFENVERIGTFFTEIEFFDILRSLNTVKSIINFFSGDIENKYPELRKLARKQSFFPLVIQKINSIIDKYGRIKNNASPKLLSIRKELSSKQSSVSTSIHRILDKAKKVFIRPFRSINCPTNKMVLLILLSLTTEQLRNGVISTVFVPVFINLFLTPKLSMYFVA